jgi:hypothetical protein
LPVVDEIAVDYGDRVRFVAVAGRADFDRTAARAGQLFSNLDWGLDDSVWDLYSVPYQPVTFLVTGDGRVFERFDGAPYSPEQLRERLDALLEG